MGVMLGVMQGQSRVGTSQSVGVQQQQQEEWRVRAQECETRALLLFDLSASQGNAEAYLQLGDFYYYQRAGLGLRGGLRGADRAAGVEKVEMQVEFGGVVGDGETEGQGLEGINGQEGDIAPLLDKRREAAQFYQRAADLRHTQALFNLGLMHEVSLSGKHAWMHASKK